MAYGLSDLYLLDADEVTDIHDEILEETGIGLQGVAAARPLDAVLGRVEHRISYGVINDVLEIAAHYAMAIAMGHTFNDGNKRAAFVAMDVFLRMNGYALAIEPQEVIEMMVATAAGEWTAERLADEIYKYLCELAYED